MRVLHEDRSRGEITLGLDTLDDLWTLRNLIQEGDLVTATTYRTAEGADDKIRAEKQEKRPMTLGVRVESVEWHDFDDHLRVLGLIETGPQDHGRHHTLAFRDEPGTRLTLQKRDGRIHEWQRRLLREAEEATKRPQVLMLAIDDSEAQFGQLASYGLRVLGTLPASGVGKRFGDPEKAKRQFYDEVLRSLKALRADPGVPFLVVGPGWWRDEFLEHAREREPALVAGAQTDGTSQGGRAGLQEALRRDLVEKVVKEHRVQVETAQVREVLARIAKGDGTVAYGPAEVLQAVQAGAAEEVLVTDEAVRHATFEALLDEADRTRCAVHVVSTSHDAGQQLQRFGGLAALLRFALG